MAFAELRQAVGLVAGEEDADALTEVFWAALHGLVTLSRGGQLRPGYASERLQLLVNQFTCRPETRRSATGSLALPPRATSSPINRPELRSLCLRLRSLDSSSGCRNRLSPGGQWPVQNDPVETDVGEIGCGR